MTIHSLTSPAAAANLGKSERGLYQQLTRDYGLANNQAALNIPTEGLTSLTIARECHEQIERDGRIIFDGRDDAGRGIGKQRLNPLVNVERDARAAFLTAMRMLGLDLGSGAGTKRSAW
jgi:hypothetical protein